MATCRRRGAASAPLTRALGQAGEQQDLEAARGLPCGVGGVLSGAGAYAQNRAGGKRI
jgi:hypothetical protein